MMTSLKTEILEDDTISHNDELTVSLHKRQLTKCPSCSLYFDNEEYCCEHLLNHFQNSQNFLAQRVDLFYWLKNYIIKPSKPSNQVITKDVNMNNIVIQKISEDGNNELVQFLCVVCGKLFHNEQISFIHSFSHFEIEIPAIDPQLKCPLCEKYFCIEESCLAHIFTHLPIIEVEKVTPSILKWLTLFFTSPSGANLVAKYDQYATLLNSNSPLLSRIRVRQINSVTSCKICQKSVCSIIDLLNNHTKCEAASSRSPFFYCFMCNFKAISKESFVEHFFVKHIICHCGYSGTDFASFQQHRVNCTVSKNGILCPLCRAKCFLSKEDLKHHFVAGGRTSCATNLKKNKWKCLVCGLQVSQKTVMEHVLNKHVRCCCGFKNRNFKVLRTHLGKCSRKNVYLVCPICNVNKCSSKKMFEWHITNCFPRNKTYAGAEIICNQVCKPEKVILRHESDDLPIKEAKLTVCSDNYLRLHF